MNTQRKMSTQKMVLGAVLTALVILLQALGASIKFGMFSITLVLIPIVIGAATCGAAIGAWLGLVFGVVVMLSGDANFFFGLNPIGTVITVLVKGIVCGYLAGLTYRLLEKFNRVLAVAVAAIVCPIVNTGIFILGCFIFFMDFLVSSSGGNIFGYIIYGIVGINFLLELGTNVVLSPIVVRILNIRKQK